MKTPIDYEAIENASGKITTGFRCEPGLKLEMAQEATTLGITLSEHLENTLANRKKLAEHIKSLENEKREQTLLTEQLREQLAHYKAEAEKLLKEKEMVTQQPSILNDRRLHTLFEALKGKQDRVINSSGDDFDLTYDSPEKVLIALIYSSTLNQ